MRRSGILFSLAASLLYFGPFLSGLCGAGTGMLPIFVGIYVLWLAAMRPAIWAEATAQGTPLALGAHLVGTTLTQVLTIFLGFGLGRGFASLSGSLDLPIWIGAAMALAAVPLCRLIGHPERPSGTKAQSGD